MSKGLNLRLQSSLDALSECLAELREAVSIVDRLDAEGFDTPISPAQLDRVYAQCLNARRTLETMNNRVS